MFAATENPLPAQPFIERARQPYDLFHALAVAAAAERIIRVVIEGNVEDGTEIEVETEQAEEPAGDLAVAPDEGNVVAITELLRVRRLVPDQPQPGHAAAFLVDRDDWLDLAHIAQVIDQFPQLGRALDIAAKENESARLHPTK
jgi:hypothetical protein